MSARSVLVLGAADHAARLQELTSDLPVELRHLAFDLPWQEIAARRAGRAGSGTAATPEVATALRDAEVVFGFGLPADTAALAARLRWVETPATGFDQLNGTGVLERSDVAVTTVGGLFAPWVAEQVFALLLGLSRQLAVFAAAQQRREWVGRGLELRPLLGSTLAIVGLGNIGHAVARAGAAFGMRVIGMRRRAGDVPPGVERVFPREALHALLGEADVVVVAVSGTPETVDLIDAAALNAMRRDAILINVARGVVVNEAALIAALREGRIAGAGLDVFVHEPLPADNPLWTLPNVMISPHIAVNVRGKLRRCVEHFAENLRRYVGGKDLADRVR